MYDPLHKHGSKSRFPVRDITYTQPRQAIRCFLHTAFAVTPIHLRTAVPSSPASFIAIATHLGSSTTRCLDTTSSCQVRRSSIHPSTPRCTPRLTCNRKGPCDIRVRVCSKISEGLPISAASHLYRFLVFILPGWLTSAVMSTPESVQRKQLEVCMALWPVWKAIDSVASRSRVFDTLAASISTSVVMGAEVFEIGKRTLGQSGGENVIWKRAVLGMDSAVAFQSTFRIMSSQPPAITVF
jgi:hypothetical protein